MRRRGEFARFVLAGVLNTLVTFLLFEGLRRVIPYLFAYSIAYVAGIGLSYLLNTGFVFGQRRTLASALRFPLVYVVQYAMGLALLWLLVDLAGINPTLAFLLVIAVSVPLTFFLTRIVLAGDPIRRSDAGER